MNMSVISGFIQLGDDNDDDDDHHHHDALWLMEKETLVNRDFLFLFTF